MQILSNATKRFLEPVDAERLGDAVLRLSLPPKEEAQLDSDDDKSSESKEAMHQPKQFLIEILEYELDEETGERTELSPRSLHASRFVERRFKHGYRRASKQGVYHNRYYVPATDYTLYLFLHTWTGKKEVSANARPLLEEMIDHESLYAKVAKRAAIYKGRLDEYLAQKIRADECTCESFPWTFNFFGHESTVALAKTQTETDVCQHCAREASQKPETFMRRDSAFMQSLDISPFIAKKGTFNPNAPDMTVYQQVCCTNAIEAPGYAFYKEPGCGKTFPSIGLIDYVTAVTHSAHNRPARILVLVPKNIRQNWLREINHFSRFDLQTSILTGENATVRTYKLIEGLVTRKKGAVVVANYETATATDRAILSVEWDLVIVDESHNFASMSTKRAKFMLKLRDVAQKRLELTGTPIRNTPFDLYTQFEYLRRGGSGLLSYNAFKNFFGEWKNIPGKGIRVLEELKNIPLLQERLAKYTFLLRKEEAMPMLPPKMYDTLECTMSPEQAQVYKQIATQLAAFIGDQGSVPDAMTINSHLTKLLRLAEITSGYAKTDEAGIHRFDPNNKLETVVEAVKEHLDQSPNSKVQIWCHFRENIKQLRARFNDIEKIGTVVFYGSTGESERADAERLFNTDPNTRIFIGSPSAGGVGLNLLGFDPRNPSAYETNSDWTIYYSQNWSSTSRRQSEDRAHRKGTRVPVRITDVTIPGSIDDMIIERVKSKIEMAMSLQDIRKILANALNPSVNGD